MSAKKKVTTKPVQGSMALWLMTPFGVLMPAAVPPDVASTLPEGTLQVRARDAAHLERFRELYCPELGPVAATPKMDYDCRAYVLREDLTRAVARMILDIDGVKFKPLAYGPKGLKSKALADRLHGVYNSMWGAATKLSDKKWVSTSHTKISQPDPRSSSPDCVAEGHLWPTGSKGGSVRVVHCQDSKCDALRSTYSGEIHYPKNHKPWQAAS